MDYGVIFETAPQDWQIIQQGTNKTADVKLGGRWRNPDGEGGEVQVRVIDEQNNVSIIPWRQCKTEAAGRWETVLNGIPAGGLYRIETQLKIPSADSLNWGYRGDMRHHIGVGDVYVIAGQSNAAGYGRDVANDAPEPGAHLLRNNGRWDMAAHPLNESTDTIHIINREVANPGHSPWLCFAKRLKHRLGIPIGLIQASLGGSPLSSWNPCESGELYHSMLETLRNYGYPIKGVLWYQGCSDGHDPLCYNTYLTRFKSFVSRLREDLCVPGLPFLTVQISRYLGILAEADNVESWGIIREAQRQAAKTIDNVYVIPSTDAGLSDAIHISASGNMVLGERMAGVALKHIYNAIGGVEIPDILEAKKISSDSVRLTFGPMTGGIYTYTQQACDLPFHIADDNGAVEIVGYELSGTSITLKLNREPGTGRYVSGAAGWDPRRMTPIDFETQIPILSFHRFPVS